MSEPPWTTQTATELYVTSEASDIIIFIHMYLSIYDLVIRGMDVK